MTVLGPGDSGPLPTPGAAFAKRALPIHQVPAGTTLFRVHKAINGPVFFDPGAQSRFNAPDRSFGTLYLAMNQMGALVETFCRELGDGDPGLSVISQAEVDARRIVQFTTTQPLRLVSCAGTGLARLGTDARLLGVPYAVSTVWAKAFHDHTEQPDGVFYPARHDPDQLCIALFERAKHAVRLDGAPAPIADHLLADFVDRYEMALDD